MTAAEKSVAADLRHRAVDYHADAHTMNVLRRATPALIDAEWYAELFSRLGQTLDILAYRYEDRP